MLSLVRRFPWHLSVRHLSYEELKNAREIDERGLRINARRYFISLRNHDGVDFVKVSEMSNYRRSQLFLELHSEMPLFMENLEAATMMKPSQLLEQEVTCFDEVSKIQFGLLSGKNKMITTALVNKDNSVKQGIRIESESVDKLLDALRVFAPIKKE